MTDCLQLFLEYPQPKYLKLYNTIKKRQYQKNSLYNHYNSKIIQIQYIPYTSRCRYVWDKCLYRCNCQCFIRSLCLHVLFPVQDIVCHQEWIGICSVCIAFRLSETFVRSRYGKGY